MSVREIIIDNILSLLKFFDDQNYLISDHPYEKLVSRFKQMNLNIDRGIFEDMIIIQDVYDDTKKFSRHANEFGRITVFEEIREALVEENGQDIPNIRNTNGLFTFYVTLLGMINRLSIINGDYFDVVLPKLSYTPRQLVIDKELKNIDFPFNFIVLKYDMIEFEGKLDRILTKDEGLITHLIAISPLIVVTVLNDYSLSVWNIQKRRIIHRMLGHTGIIRDVKLLLDGRVVTCSNDTTLRIWNPLTGECEKILEGHEKEVHKLCLLGNDIISGSMDKTIIVWDSKTGHHKKVLKGFTSTIMTLSVTSTRIISGHYNGDIRIWNPLKEKSIGLMVFHSDIITVIGVINDTQIIVGYGNGLVEIYDISGLLLHSLRLERNIKFIKKIPGSQESKFAIVSGATIVCVWDTQTINFLEGHTDTITGIVCLMDGSIATSSFDKTIIVWNPISGEILFDLKGHRDYITCLDTTGRYLISGGHDKLIMVWK